MVSHGQRLAASMRRVASTAGQRFMRNAPASCMLPLQGAVGGLTQPCCSRQQRLLLLLPPHNMQQLAHLHAIAAQSCPSHAGLRLLLHACIG